MRNKKFQRIMVSIIALIIAAIMILSLIAPALASDSEVSSELTTEAVSQTASQEGDRSFNFLSQEASNVILPGIKVRNIDISGLTDDEAEAKVSTYVAERRQDSLTINVNGQPYTITLENVGLTWTNPGDIAGAAYLGKSGNIINRYKFFKDCTREDYTIPLTFAIVEDAIVSFVAQAAALYDYPAVEPSLSMGDDGDFVINDGSNGMAVNQAEAVAMILDYFYNTWQEGDITLDIPWHVVEPRVSSEAMRHVKDIIGSGSTDFNGSSPDRVTNVTNAVDKVNGTVLMPGEQLSLTEKLVPFEAENGYAVAPSYAGGVVTESYGGGVCQVSTTLYMAVLQAELQIDERFSHSMMVSYIEPSMDAAIAEGVKDLKFTNNTDAPIYIKGWTDGTLIHFEIYGHETDDPNRRVVYESQILEETPATDKITVDENLRFGLIYQTDYGHHGMASQLIKKVTVGGETTEETVSVDDYQMAPICYTVGIKGAGKEAIDAINAVISGSSLIGDAVSAINHNGGDAMVYQTAGGENPPDESVTAAQ